jgi:hypothetical protein
MTLYSAQATNARRISFRRMYIPPVVSVRMLNEIGSEIRVP